MKIIQLIQKPQLRGAEIFACQLSNHLEELGHQVIVVAIFEGDATLPFKGETIKLDRPISNRFYDLKGWKQFNKIVAGFNPDIIQANAADTLKFAASSKMIFKWHIPIIFRNANKMGDFIDSKLKWNLNKMYLSKVAYVISVSKECEKDFIKTFKFSSDKIKTVEIGVERKMLGKTPLDLKMVYNKGPVIVHIGGFVKEKNHKGLIEIFIHILKEHPTAQLLLIGKGKLENEIKVQISDLKITNNVHFVGYRNDVLDILHNAQAFVLPSFIEGLPGVILEAMYCGVPVVAYNVGGVGEVVHSNKTGWLIEKGDRDNFILALKSILDKNSIIEIIRGNAKKQILNNFLNKKIAKRFVEEYERVFKI